LVSFFTAQAFPWLLQIGSGASTVASFQALSNIMGLSNPILIGIGALITATAGGLLPSDALRASVRHAAFAALLVLPWMLVINVAPQLVVNAFYKHHFPSLGSTAAFHIMSAAYALEIIALPVSCVMSGLGDARALFAMQCFGATAFIAASVPALHHELTGAAVCLGCVQLSRAGYGIRYCLQHFRRQRSAFVPILSAR
jgi:hypothetical protein